MTLTLALRCSINLLFWDRNPNTWVGVYTQNWLRSQSLHASPLSQRVNASPKRDSSPRRCRYPTSTQRLKSCRGQKAEVVCRQIQKWTAAKSSFRIRSRAQFSPDRSPWRFWPKGSPTSGNVSQKRNWRKWRLRDATLLTTTT